MVVLVSGKHMQVGDSLHQHVELRISGGIKKYLNNITQAKVNFSKIHNLYHVDINIHDSDIGHVKAAAESDDAYAAFDNAIVKVEKQLRKYKGKIRDLSKRNKEHGDDMLSATKYVLNIPKPDTHEEEYSNEPVVIAEQMTNVEKLTVSEAIMKMELAHLPALMFINKLNDRLNVVYQRVDGNISWLDPGEKK